MGDVALIAVMLAAFAVAIGLVQVLGRLIESGGRDDLADGLPDAGGTQMVPADQDVTGLGGPW
jgi:hypothetical protein